MILTGPLINNSLEATMAQFNIPQFSVKFKAKI